MKKRFILAFLAISLSISGCTDSQTTQKELRAIQDIPYTIIKYSQYPSDIDAKESFRVYHSDNFDDLKSFDSEYKKLTGENAPIFDGNMVVIVSGKKSTGGHKVSIADVKDVGRFTEVTVLFQKPGKDCLSTMALTNPYLVVEFPNDHKEVKFIKRDIEIDCK